MMLIISALLLLISNAVTIRRDKSILYSRVAITILISSLLICINSFYLNFHERGIGIYSGLLQTTAITHVFHMFVFLITAIILQLNSFYPRKVWSDGHSSALKLLFFRFKYFNSPILNKMSEQYRVIEYPLIILFVLLGGVFLISSCDLISIFLSLELQSYGLYILCVVYKDSERATSGGLTYFLLGGLSSCFILLAFGLLYGNSGNTSFDGLYIINSITNVNDNFKPTVYTSLAGLYESNYLNFALIIMSVGFLFKISAAPFHFWSPDVYDAIPTVVTTFVATFAKISILILLLELVHYTSSAFVPRGDMLEGESLFFNMSWTFTLLLSSFLSLVIGSVLGLTQSRIKRLYAYSTISHVGFILLALSVNSIESIQSFIFYLMQYTITNINAFMLLTAIAYSLYLYVENKDSSEDGEGVRALDTDIWDKNNSPIQLISQLKGYFYINPFIALSLGITLFSFAGIPPMVGFFAKQMVLSSALDNGYVFMSLIGILTSVVSAYYYLAIVKQMFFNKADYVINPVLKNISLKTNISSKLFSSSKSDIIVNVNNILLSSFLTITISLLTLVILLFIFAPQEWLNMSMILALILSNS